MHLGLQFGDRCRRYWLEFASARAELDEDGTSVGGIRGSRHQACALHEPNHGRHRLLREARPSRELANAQPIFVEQRYEHRPERRTHFWEATPVQLTGQLLVPTL